MSRDSDSAFHSCLDPTRLRFGLCCLFSEAEIRFRTTTAAFLARKWCNTRSGALQFLSELIADNLSALFQAIEFCHDHGIGAFRISSQLLPLYTHPDQGYQLDLLPESERLIAQLEAVRQLAQKHQIRLTFHPDQFVVLNSPRQEVVESSLRELEYHGVVAELVGADVINIHAGGAYGNKQEALERLVKTFGRLTPTVQERLTLENDDKLFSPKELLPVCMQLGIPFVYDVHHHRCCQDGKEVSTITEEAIKSWNGREPLFHLSSPRDGWSGRRPQLHSDYIDPDDFPDCWKKLQKPVTIDVEAKAKELAIARLQSQLLDHRHQGDSGRCRQKG